MRLVKLIGDAVMLVSPEPEPMLDVTLRLVDLAAEDEAFPPLRAGIACGQAVHRWGDWFGTPVNLASRLTTRARPSTVLVSEEIRDAVGDGYDVLRRRPQEAQGLLVAGARLPRQKVRRCSASSAWALTQTGVWRPVRE